MVNKSFSCGGSANKKNTDWGIGSNGLTYTFSNEVEVHGSGSLDPIKGEIGVSVPFRKRIGKRDTDDALKEEEK